MTPPFTWISVKDELPGLHEDVLIWLPGFHQRYQTGWMTKFNGWRIANNMHVDPTHWMRVEPPKEDA